MCQEQSKSYRARAGKTFFATQAPTYFIISYVSTNVYSSHAKSMLPFSKLRSRDALRAGLVAIRSRQGGRLSKVRTDPRAVGLNRCIHTRSCCKRKRKRDRPENILGASKADLISPKALGKTPLVTTIGRGSQLLASPNSRKMGQDFSQNWTGRFLVRLFIRKTQRLRSQPGPFFRNIPDISIIALQTIFPKGSGYFDHSIFGKRFPKYLEYFEKMVGGCDFPKYLEYFGKLVPTKNEELLHLPDYGRGSPDRFGQVVRRKYEAVASSRGSPGQFSEKRSGKTRASATSKFHGFVL